MKRWNNQSKTHKLLHALLHVRYTSGRSCSFVSDRSIGRNDS
jgi:hypothetical protein